MAVKNKSEILLETGTNEIEIMEFKINDKLYGINVAKVREIMVAEAVTAMPLAHPVVEGVFKPRGSVITVVNLAKYLYGNEATNGERDLFIVTNFNRMHIAFRVNSVEGIVRISWTDIQKPDKTVSGGEEGVATGITEINGDLVVILDFEKIVSEIAPRTGIQTEDIAKLGERKVSNEPIVLAEDSILLSKMILECLHKAGYKNITKFDNGQEAWDYLRSIQDEDTLAEKVSIVITDIEMPAMDGHRLTKLIKSDKLLKELPVIIFSSLINEELYIKGKQIGADEQISKPEIGSLVEVIDHLLEKKRR
ncbi:chemotaxis protein [Anaerotignum propionicum]|uniref:Stage 0 sporulation protein A homolog n=1 Tax=Anaerotignum propionicum DSM 1682 TaxID=991789 RepID=A0A0X8VC99_ANAPI|nr:chemotaxis protein [Anaerotignum propionicum]AMJ42375.1 chemotaxis protein CheV [Anaerotignum propionicum DSM 1682]MEA5058208.1 chemotaxis protein [Anaerotignum propionicum]SHF00717.1 two-component system, chemotaxis family, response regulator CheV [[Clostridium] propionicum DSM 1682] [Anaerotignum propionicum DSM 1682]